MEYTKLFNDGVIITMLYFSLKKYFKKTIPLHFKVHKAREGFFYNSICLCEYKPLFWNKHSSFKLCFTLKWPENITFRSSSLLTVAVSIKCIQKFDMFIIGEALFVVQKVDLLATVNIKLEAEDLILMQEKIWYSGEII